MPGDRPLARRSHDQNPRADPSRTSAIAFLLTGGQVADCTAGAVLLQQMPAARILRGDKGYDSNAVRQQIEENGTLKIPDAAIDELTEIHARLVEADKDGHCRAAVRHNWYFHSSLFKYADTPQLLAILENIWLRNGPLINYQHPHAPPTYAGAHQHLHLLEALRKRQPEAVRLAIQADMIEGGTPLVELLERLARGEITREELRASGGADESYGPHTAELVRGPV